MHHVDCGSLHLGSSSRSSLWVLAGLFELCRSLQELLLCSCNLACADVGSASGLPSILVSKCMLPATTWQLSVA